MGKKTIHNSDGSYREVERYSDGTSTSRTYVPVALTHRLVDISDHSSDGDTISYEPDFSWTNLTGRGAIKN